MREQHPPSTLMLVGLVLGVLAINRLAFARPDTCTVGADDPGSSGMRPTPPPRHTKPSQPAQPRRRVIVLRQFQAHPPPAKHAPFRPPQTRLEEGGPKTHPRLFVRGCDGLAADEERAGVRPATKNPPRPLDQKHRRHARFKGAVGYRPSPPGNEGLKALAAALLPAQTEGQQTVERCCMVVHAEGTAHTGEEWDPE